MRRVLVAGMCLVLMAGCASNSPAGAPPPSSGETVASHFSPPPAFPGPTWTRDGRAVDGRELNSIAGPEHCGWQSAVMMHLGWPLGTVSRTSAEIRQYLRDPDGVIGQSGRVAFAAGAALPADAVDTGYRKGGLELWLSESNPDAAFLRTVDDVERWPRADPVVACA